MDRGLPLTRRGLLAAGGAGAVTLAAGGLLGALPGSPATLRSVQPVRSLFTPHVGTDVLLRAEGGRRVRTRLVAVEDLRHSARRDENAFGLLLHGDGPDTLEQTLVRMEHPSFRTVPLLVSPSGTGSRGQDYFVVVNRISPQRL